MQVSPTTCTEIHVTATGLEPPHSHGPTDTQKKIQISKFKKFFIESDFLSLFFKFKIQMPRLNVSKSDNIFDRLPLELREHVFSFAQSKYIWKLRTADGKVHYEWNPPRDPEIAKQYGGWHTGCMMPPEGPFLDAFIDAHGIDMTEW